MAPMTTVPSLSGVEAEARDGVALPVEGVTDVEPAVPLVVASPAEFAVDLASEPSAVRGGDPPHPMSSTSHHARIVHLPSKRGLRFCDTARRASGRSWLGLVLP
jgi:hypothetical protein